MYHAGHDNSSNKNDRPFTASKAFIEKLSNLLRHQFDYNVNQGHVAFLLVGEEVFFTNTSLLRLNIERDFNILGIHDVTSVHLSRAFINVSSHLPTPRLCTRTEKDNLIESTLQPLMLKIHSFLTLVPPNSGVIQTHFPHSYALPTISGYLLEYPFIYVLLPDTHHSIPEGNCLSNVSLTLFTHKVNSRVLLAYTIPTKIFSELSQVQEKESSTEVETLSRTFDERTSSILTTINLLGHISLTIKQISLHSVMI
jgi:hypothetical protein